MSIFSPLLKSVQKTAAYSASPNKVFSALDSSQYAAYNRYRPEGPKALFCYLPFNSLTFSMSGNVFVCNYNKNILLGQYPANTIEEIWNGAPANTLRDHMRHNDLNYGCQHCKFYFDKGKFTNLRPHSFDKYYADTSAKFPRVMEFELSNECNLECQMCNGNVSSSIRKNQDGLPPLPNPYDDAFVAQLAPYLPHLQEAKFYGGEPFLIPVYYKIWEQLAAVNPGCKLFLITNGTHWNNKIKQLVEDLHLEMAISIDSLQKERLEKIRKNVVYEKLMENIERFNQLMKSKGKTLSLSFTMQQENWMELPDFIQFCNEREASVYVSYLDSPKQYAIAELGQAALLHISAVLAAVSLPKNNALQQHNAQCLADFLTYVQKFIDHENEPQYDDYLAQSAVAAQSQQVRELNNQTVYVKKPVSRETLWQLFATHVAQHPDDNALTADQLLQKIDLVFTSLAPEEMPKVYGMIAQSPLDKAVASLTEQPIETLQTDAVAQWKRIKLL